MTKPYMVQWYEVSSSHERRAMDESLANMHFAGYKIASVTPMSPFSVIIIFEKRRFR